MKEDSIKYILSKLFEPSEEDKEDILCLLNVGWTPNEIITFFNSWEYMTEEEQE